MWFQIEFFVHLHSLQWSQILKGALFNGVDLVIRQLSEKLIQSKVVFCKNFNMMNWNIEGCRYYVQLSMLCYFKGVYKNETWHIMLNGECVNHSENTLISCYLREFFEISRPANEDLWPDRFFLFLVVRLCSFKSI